MLYSGTDPESYITEYTEYTKKIAYNQRHAGSGFRVQVLECARGNCPQATASGSTL